MKHTVRLIVAAAALLIGTAAQAATYDATTDFQTGSNPGSVWSYGYSAASNANNFTLFNAQSTIPGTIGWSEAGYNTSQVPAAWINNSGSTMYGAANGQLSLHAGPVPNGDAAILRFTAAQTGNYNVTGQFFAGDIGAESGSVILGGQASPLAFFQATTDASTFSLTSVLINAGQTLDFVVGNNGSYFSGTTPITVSITSAVPEADTYAMMLAGLGLLGFIARRKRAA